MILSRTTDRYTARTRFLLIYGATLACLIVIVLAFLHREPLPVKTVVVREPAPAVTGAAFAVLTRYEEQYAHLIDEGRYRELDGANVRLSLVLDSLERAGEAPAVAYGRQVLDVHRRTADQFSNVSTAADNTAPIEELKRALKEKNRRIAQLTTTHKKSDVVSASYQYRPAKGESMEALKQSNVNLQLGFRDIMNKLWDSYRAYNLLKKENDGLRRQLSEARH